ncbi:MAG: hypothetical protein ACRELY_01320 [Polyangiaceae bacterium]
MKRARAGKTVTFSISVDVETQKILKREAKRGFEGNVSALITAMAQDAKRQAAAEWLLSRPGVRRPTDEEMDEFMAEVRGRPKKKRHKAA